MPSGLIAPVLVWFRQDLRLADNPALSQAVKTGQPVIPVFLWATASQSEEGDWPAGGASRTWFDASLKALAKDIQALGSPLVIRSGTSTQAMLAALVAETGATAIFFNRRFEPAAQAVEVELAHWASQNKVGFHGFNGNLLFDPSQLANQQGNPYQVYTPFWKACLSKSENSLPLPAPSKLPAPLVSPETLSVEDLGLLPTSPRWDQKMLAYWTPGEQGAIAALAQFIKSQTIDGYQDSRNRPDQVGTSRLSPHLHFGEITPQQIWHAVHQVSFTKKPAAESAQTFLKEVVWREFAYHLLFHFPQTTTEPLKPQFKHFPWQPNPAWLMAWQRGQTGYPIVDAGMRELWETGWMHNRVRMIVASFLVKNLLIPWQEGARWFWDTLLDADLASNTLGWQWTAGCGADAAPYFRIFNPMMQGAKFDPDGVYIRRWVPELANLSNKTIHQPWTALPLELAAAGIQLGRDYPEPLVDHYQARDRALAAYQQLKQSV